MDKIHLPSLLLISLLTLTKTSLSQLSPLTIGTLHPGDSVIVVYDVTINNPLPAGTTQISNQGNISGTGFTAFVTDDPATTAANDATITPLNLFPLPVVLGQFKAYKKVNDVELTWKAFSEVNVSKYEVERSMDGRTFITIGEIAARNSTSATEYSFLDISPHSNKNYYRLQMIDINGTFKYSPVIVVDWDAKGQSVLFFPNPVLNKILNLQVNNLPKGKYSLILSTSTGQKILTYEITHNGASTSEGIQLPVNIKYGIYTVELKLNGTNNRKEVRFSELLLVK